MGKEIIYTVLLICGILPATLLFSYSTIGIVLISSNENINSRDIIILISMLLGIMGYVGLITSLVAQKSPKLNLTFLLIGLTGFILFTSFEGGIRAWKWLLLFEEPDEWYIMGLPLLAFVIAISVNFYRIMSYSKLKKEA